MVTVRSGHVEGGHLVLDDALTLPDGTPVRISVEIVKAVDQSPEDEPSTPESTTDFASEPFFGMWADRDDMADSAAWVRRQRDEWHQRLTRSD